MFKLRSHYMSQILSAAALLACGASCVVACSSGSVDESGNVSQAVSGKLQTIARVKGPNAESAAPAGAHLNYYGGPVLSSPKVVTIFWGPNVAYTSQINAFYAGVTNSPYMDWLSEYYTGSQTIGRGTLAGTYTDSTAPTGTITDAQVQAEISRLIHVGSVPPPDGNTLYAIHYAPGVTLTNGSDTSCVAGGFCGYHGTFNRNGTYVYYSNVMDMTTGVCATGCGSDPSPYKNTTSVASHELIEAATDPGVGLATSYGPPLGWYDPTNGEIGDICNQQHATVTGGDGAQYTVQKLFSNRLNDCVASAPPLSATSSMLLWLRADAGVTVASGGGGVTSWADQSPNQNTAAMTTASREPAYVSGAINGYPVIRFNGAQSLILTKDLAPTQFSFFVVGKNSEPNETFGMILGPAHANGNNQIRWEDTNDSNVVGIGNNLPSTTTFIGNTRVYHELSGTYDGTKLSIYRDGQLKGTSTFSTTGPWTLSQVGAWFSSYFLTGDIAEVIMYGAALPDASRQDVDTYLVNKYALPAPVKCQTNTDCTNGYCIDSTCSPK